MSLSTSLFNVLSRIIEEVWLEDEEKKTTEGKEPDDPLRHIFLYYANITQMCYRNLDPFEHLREFTFHEDNSVFRPNFFTAIDSYTNSAVICIRGTKTYKDAITNLDLAIHNLDEPSYVHKGHYLAGDYVYKKCKEFIDTCIEKSINNIVLLGHSYGASVASVLYLILSQEYPRSNITAFVYAPMPCMSLDLAQRLSGKITSIVLEDDLVPRLTCKNMSGYFTEKKIPFDRDFYLPGDVYQIRGKTLHRLQNHHYFDNIRITAKSISDHLLHNYVRRLQDISPHSQSHTS